MINSVQGPGAIGQYSRIPEPAGDAELNQQAPPEALDVKISYRKQVVETLTYERTGTVASATHLQEAAAPDFETLLSRLLEKQGVTYEEAMGGKAVEIDDETRAEALELISEDGYWGINKTSDRILQFAIANAGNDPSKLEEIKAAIDKGFGMASEALGGSLPDISTKTYDAVMEKLGLWADQGNA